MTTVFETCSHCGGVHGAIRISVDGELVDRRSASVKQRYLIAKMTNALREIAAGIVDEGGNRHSHPDATRIAREALGLINCTKGQP